jgi:Zn ribbon nucleic-acid-binding protein
VRTAILAPLLFCSVLSDARSETTFVGQPIPFSHKQHAVNAHLQCADCHTLAPSGEVYSVPTGKTCMACHSVIAKNSEAIKELKAYVDENEPVPWIRVYEIPSFVEFNHKTHINAGAKCSVCHGDVAARDRLWRETDLSMTGCVNCHREKAASTNCTTCHDIGN